MIQPADLRAAPTETASPPRWIAPWLALLAPLYVVSPLALLALPQLRKLSTTAKYVLAFYALSQQLPALFSPEPLLASLLALARTLLMFGLMGVGVMLGSSDRLKPFAIGLGVVFVTAIAYSVLGGADVLTSRLGHPYMTSITLGLGGAFGVWIALFSSGKLLWRVPLGFAALAILLLSGSRGPLAAALVGCLAGFIIQRGRRVAIALLLGAGLLAGSFYVGDRLGVSAITRLSSADTTGRDIVWYNTLSVIQSQPWTGVGNYRLGKYLAPPGDCTLFSSTDGTAPVCPNWVRQVGNPWLIAHNATLQQLAETGPLGLLGLFMLIGSILFAATINRSRLGVAIIIGLLVSTINDNTLLVPSPFFAEAFWIIAGTQLVLLPSIRPLTGWLTAGVAVMLSLPLLVGNRTVTPVLQPLPPKLSMLNAPALVTSPRRYTVFVKLEVPPGHYRVTLNSCVGPCVTIATLPFVADQAGSPVLTLQGDLRPVKTQQLELRLLPGQSTLDLRPLGQRTWTVMVKP